MTDRSFELANDESRARLARLTVTLTRTQLATDLGEGWTVASALAHMGFWDRWQAERWTEMLAGTWRADDASVLAAEHLANLALHPYWSGIDASNVPNLAIEAAAHLDALVARAPDALVAELEGGPNAFLLSTATATATSISTTSRACWQPSRSGAGPSRLTVQTALVRLLALSSVEC